jgi:hypothetical protein
VFCVYITDRCEWLFYNECSLIAVLGSSTMFGVYLLFITAFCSCTSGKNNSLMFFSCHFLTFCSTSLTLQCFSIQMLLLLLHPVLASESEEMLFVLCRHIAF